VGANAPAETPPCDPERGLLYTGRVFGMVNLIVMLALLDVVWFNIRGDHLFPVVAFLGMVIVLVGIGIGLFFLMAKKNTRGFQ